MSYLQCTKFDFGWSSAPDPAGGAYNIPTDSLTGFKKPTSKGKKGRGRKEGRKGKEGASTRFNRHCLVYSINTRNTTKICIILPFLTNCAMELHVIVLLFKRK